MEKSNKQKYWDRYHQENYEQINIRIRKESEDILNLLDKVPDYIGISRTQFILNALKKEADIYTPQLNKLKAFQEHIGKLPSEADMEYDTVYVGIETVTGANKSEISGITLLDDKGNIMESLTITPFVTKDVSTTEQVLPHDQSISCIKGILNNTDHRVFFSEREREILCSYNFTCPKMLNDLFITSLIGKRNGKSITLKEASEIYAPAIPADATELAQLIRTIYQIKRI